MQTPRPPPANRLVTPTEDEFESWCLHPVTQFVAQAMENAADDQREEWLRQSWGSGMANPVLLMELRTRADAYRAFLETGLEDYLARIK